jgi:hypothetical protein
MATSHEQEIAKDIVVAWLSIPAGGHAPVPGLQDPERAGEILATMYKTIVKAVSETSSPASAGDSTA